MQRFIMVLEQVAGLRLAHLGELGVIVSKSLFVKRNAETPHKNLCGAFPLNKITEV